MIKKVIVLKKIIFLILLIILISCNKDKKDSKIVLVDKFEKEISLTGEQILKNDYAASSIYSIDTLLLVRQTSKSDVFFNVYNKNSLKKIGTLGLRGDRPDSWLFAYYSGQYVKDKNSIKIWLNGSVKGKFMLVNITKSLQNSEGVPVIDKLYNINTELFPNNNILYINDSVLIGNSGYFDTKRCRIKKYNLKTSKIIYSELFPSILNSNLLVSDELYVVYFGNLMKKPNENIFVSAMECFDRIDFFDENLTLIKTIASGDKYSDDKIDVAKFNFKKGNPLNSLNIYYFRFDITSNYIYTLYYNQSYIDYGKVLKPTEIRIFDWDGNAKFLLKIPDYLMNISVDEKNGYIYGVDYFNEKVLRYNISDFIQYD